MILKTLFIFIVFYTTTLNSSPIREKKPPTLTNKIQKEKSPTLYIKTTPIIIRASTKKPQIKFNPLLKPKTVPISKSLLHPFKQ